MYLHVEDAQSPAPVNRSQGTPLQVKNVQAPALVLQFKNTQAPAPVYSKHTARKVDDAQALAQLNVQHTMFLQVEDAQAPAPVNRQHVISLQVEDAQVKDVQAPF